MKLQIVGFGPAALGLFITADRDHQLERFLEGGVVIHERADSLEQWSGLEYLIEANSPVKDFFAGIRRDGIFAHCLDTPKLQEWLKNDQQIISLKEISGFLRNLAQVIVDLSKLNDNLSILWHSKVVSLQRRDGQFCTCNASMRMTKSRYLVMASGSCPGDLQIESHYKLEPRDLVAADSLLRGNENIEIELSVENREAIVVVGGSHSGVSSICYLLENFGDKIPEGFIHLYSKSPFILWSKSVDDAEQVSSSDIVDSRTGEVNKFSGLRASAKAMIKTLCANEEKRVVLHVGDFDRSAVASEYCRANKALFVNATGYQPRLPTMLNEDGSALIVDINGGNACKHADTLELTSNGVAIHGLYGIGLGFANRGESGFEVGINFFHGVCASRLISSLFQSEEQQQLQAMSDKTIAEPA